LKQRSYETKEGEKRSVVEMDVDDVGPVLRNATAKVTRVARSENGGSNASAAPADDPWAAPAPMDEPPF
jgi:single-strand DNA-binding protein